MPEDKTDHDLLTEIHSVLLGTNGQGGLCRDFEGHKQDDMKFRQDYYQFKRKIIGILAFSAGSGALGISIVKLVGS